MNLREVSGCPDSVSASVLKNTANELILMDAVISIADLLWEGLSNPMLQVSSWGLPTPFLPFWDKDKRTYLRASSQPQVSKSYYTVLPRREYF